MIVQCISNNLELLPSEIRKFYMTQNAVGVVDLTIGASYEVFGKRSNEYGKFYLILTNTLQSKLPWWMPEPFFKLKDSSVPLNWRQDSWKGYGREVVEADPIYFDAMEDVEDGTERGYAVFKEMRKNQSSLSSVDSPK